MTIQLFGILRDDLGIKPNDDYIPHVLGVCAQFDVIDIFENKLAIFPIYKFQTTVPAVLLKIECNCISYKSIKLII